MRFQAYAALKDYKSVLKDNFVLPADPTSLGSDAAVAKEQEKKIKQKRECVAALTLALKTSKLMKMVIESNTDEYKIGISKEVKKTLLKKYHPVDNIAGVEATRELEKLEFKKSRDPDEFFTQLAVLPIEI